jgi:5'-nucleotidase
MGRRAPLVAVILAVACARPMPPPLAAAHATTATTATRTISIVATTDLHGHVKTLPWLSSHVRTVREARRADGGGVLLVDSGDMWQGTLESNLSEGGAVVRAYNALGYDAVAIGNHEFDFGPVGPNTVPRAPGDHPTGNIEKQARLARFPFLAANVVSREGGAWTPHNVRPSTIVTVAGVQVGLIGVTTIGTPTSTDPRNLVRLRVTPLRDAVVAEAQRLRASGATAVVVLAHAGGRCDTFTDPDDLGSCRPQSEVLQLARALPAHLVDVIAAGHTHQGIAHRVNGIAVVQSFNEGRAFSRVDLLVDRRSGQVAATRIHAPRLVCGETPSKDVESWRPDECAPPPYEGRPITHDPRMVGVLRRDIAAARRRADQPLGVDVTQRYWHSSREESPASNLVVDLLRAARPDSDLAIYNATGTRAVLQPGPVTYGDMYALLPFDSVVATATLSARTLGESIARALTRGTVPIVSGVEADVTCQAGAPRVSLSRGGTPIAPETTLSVVTSEFLASGGSGVFQDLEAQFTLQLDTPMREAVVSAVPAEADRIRRGVTGAYDASRRRVRFPEGTLPFRCPPPAP